MPNKVIEMDCEKLALSTTTHDWRYVPNYVLIFSIF